MIKIRQAGVDRVNYVFGILGTVNRENVCMASIMLDLEPGQRYFEICVRMTPPLHPSQEGN